MNWLDIAIIVVVALATFVGFRMGIIRAAATLVGVVGGVYVASAYHDQAAKLIAQFTESEQAAAIGGYALLFVVIMVAAFVAGGVARRFMRLFFLGWVDTIAGAGLGFVLSVAAVMVLLVPLRGAPLLGLGGTIDRSPLANTITDAAPKVRSALPSSFGEMTELLSRG